MPSLQPSTAGRGVGRQTVEKRSSLGLPHPEVRYTLVKSSAGCQARQVNMQIWFVRMNWKYSSKASLSITKVFHQRMKATRRLCLKKILATPFGTRGKSHPVENELYLQHLNKKSLRLKITHSLYLILPTSKRCSVNIIHCNGGL